MSFLDEIKAFTKTSLKNVETRVSTVDGVETIESKCNDGTVDVRQTTNRAFGFVCDLKPDLQIGQVLPFLSFGSQDVVQDIEILRGHRVTHILNVASGITCNVFDNNQEFVYKQVELLDIPETNIRRVFKICFEFIDNCNESDRHRHVFVHCNAGVSRSATIVIAYIMSRRKMRFDQAYDYVRTRRSVARPNDGFLHQLRQYDLELYDRLSEQTNK